MPLQITGKTAYSQFNPLPLPYPRKGTDYYSKAAWPHEEEVKAEVLTECSIKTFWSLQKQSILGTHS